MNLRYKIHHILLTKQIAAVKPLSLQIRFVALSLCSILLIGCAPTVNTRGNLLQDYQLQGLESGISSKQDIEQKLGSPTSTDPFDPNNWYYIGEITETKAFFTPNVTKRRVVKVSFAEDGSLAHIAEIDEKAGKEIELVKKTTRAGGVEMNAFQQFMGNLGKFNSSQMPGAGQRTQGQ
jgi:outer membrane protein assembly factor BamE (lipoprotein component of BamABCDE complex)